MMEDKLEGSGLPAQGLVFLDVSLVLDLSIVKTYDYINHVVITLPLMVYEGT